MAKQMAHIKGCVIPYDHPGPCQTKVDEVEMSIKDADHWGDVARPFDQQRSDPKQGGGTTLVDQTKWRDPHTSINGVGSDGATTHYGAGNDPYEVIKVLDAWEADAYQFNIIKYVARWRKKGGIKDLEKAKFYLDRYIQVETGKQEGKTPSTKDQPLTFKVQTKDKKSETTYLVRPWVMNLLHPKLSNQDIIDRLAGQRITSQEADALLIYHNIPTGGDVFRYIMNSVKGRA